MGNLLQQHADILIVKIVSKYDFNKSIQVVYEGTCHPDIVNEFGGDVNSQPGKTDENIVIWDFIQKEWVLIPCVDVQEMEFPGLYDCEFDKNITPDMMIRNGLPIDIMSYVKEYQGCDYASTDRLNIPEEYLSDILESLDISVSDYSSMSDSDLMSTARDRWLNIINEYNNNALKSLEKERVLASDNDDDETIEEIDIITQMLHDLPIECENALKTIDSIDDIARYWPPLLLPGPDFILPPK